MIEDEALAAVEDEVGGAPTLELDDEDTARGAVAATLLTELSAAADEGAAAVVALLLCDFTEDADAVLDSVLGILLALADVGARVSLGAVVFSGTFVPGSGLGNFGLGAWAKA